MVLGTVGRGGDGNQGQRIRDEILSIQSRNNCKGGMMVSPLHMCLFAESVSPQTSASSVESGLHLKSLFAIRFSSSFHSVVQDCGTYVQEQWHQKLHNNTSPDDVEICKALIAYLRRCGMFLIIMQERHFWLLLVSNSCTLNTHFDSLSVTAFKIEQHTLRQTYSAIATLVEIVFCTAKSDLMYSAQRFWPVHGLMNPYEPLVEPID
jgi:hypothetical protein